MSLRRLAEWVAAATCGLAFELRKLVCHDHVSLGPHTMDGTYMGEMADEQKQIDSSYGWSYCENGNT